MKSGIDSEKAEEQRMARSEVERFSALPPAGSAAGTDGTESFISRPQTVPDPNKAPETREYATVLTHPQYQDAT